MYTENDIEIFLKKLHEYQNQASLSKKHRLIFNPNSFVDLGDEKQSFISSIDKNMLKDLVQHDSVYRHKVIRLIAEICKEGWLKSLRKLPWLAFLFL